MNRIDEPEERFRRLHESLADAFVQVRMDGAIQETNEAFRRMTGYSGEELARMTYQQLTPERWHAAEARVVVDQVLRQGHSEVYEKEYRRKDGTVFPAELRTFLLRDRDGAPAGMWAIARDLTRRHAIDAQLEVSSRLAAVATLVAGVAHEINNPLASEIGNVGFAIEEVEEVLGLLQDGQGPDREGVRARLCEVLEALREAQASGQRIARIVRDMARFAGLPTCRERVRLSEVVARALLWLPGATGAGDRIRVADGGAPDVSASGLEVEQVLFNLVRNAVQSMPDGRAGVVTIRIAAGPGPAAVLEVEDEGTGMDAETLGRAFDPFFSTRRPGPGPGMGLPVVHAIVRALGGKVTARSTPGVGSVFRVELPALAAEPPAA